MSRGGKKPRATRRTPHGESGNAASVSRISPLPAAPAKENVLFVAIAISVFVHALALSLHFKFPEASRALQDRALDIILVNSKSARAPTNAQALAQNNLDGGGNTDEDRRVKTPLPPSPQQQDGKDLEQAEKRVQALEAKQQKLLAQARSKPVTPVAPSKEVEALPEPVPEAPVSGRDLANSALEMARLEGQISKATDDYNKRPRKKFIGARTREYSAARYIEDWRLKVERVGTLNYPAAAKGKLYGSLVLTVAIKSDGSVDSIEINRSSGHKVLDDAARRIVGMAGPFAPIPPDLRRDYDQLVITRSWNFTRGNALETDNAN